jgi:mRNA interferase MazF
MELMVGDVVLCEFFFADLQSSKKRPVIVFKDNLPYDDFIALPISSQIDNLHSDEHLIDPSSFKQGAIPKTSKVMVRKTMVVSKRIIVKKYGQLNDAYLKRIQNDFCRYFGCE